MYNKTLEKNGKVTPQVVYQSLQGHLSVAQNFIISLDIPSEFAFLMSLKFNSHILGVSEDMLCVPKYTVRFLRLCSSDSFSNFMVFVLSGKCLISGPKSFFIL